MRGGKICNAKPRYAHRAGPEDAINGCSSIFLGLVMGISCLGQ